MPSAFPNSQAQPVPKASTVTNFPAAWLPVGPAQKVGERKKIAAPVSSQLFVAYPLPNHVPQMMTDLGSGAISPGT